MIMQTAVLLGLAITTSYSFFIAMRIRNAETITVCLIIAIELFLQLKMTYNIVQLHNMVKNEITENVNIAKQKVVTNLALAELTENMVPVIYAIGIVVAVVTTLYTFINILTHTVICGRLISI